MDHGSKRRSRIKDHEARRSDQEDQRSMFYGSRIKDHGSSESNQKKTRIKDQPRIKHLRIKDQKKDEFQKGTLLGATTRLGRMMRE